MKPKITEFPVKKTKQMRFLEVMGEEYLMFNGRISEAEVMEAAVKVDLPEVMAKIADLQKEEKGLNALLKNAEPQEEELILKKVKQNETQHLHWLLVLYTIFCLELLKD